MSIPEFTEWMRRFVNFNKYRFDGNTTNSSKWKIELSNRIEAGASDVKSYEEDCISRFVENTLTCTNVPKSILLKILKKVKQDSAVRVLVIRWMYGLDMVLNKELTEAYFCVIKLPSEFSDFDRQINPVVLKDLLHSVKLDKKEFKSLKDVRIYSK
jgi:hypothetical protein